MEPAPDPAALALVIGLGGNIGAPEAIVSRFARARRAIGDELGAATRASPVYRTVPEGPIRAQPTFLNAAVLVPVYPPPNPRALIAFLLDLEKNLGRNRGRQPPMGPREIDLDWLLLDERVIVDEGPPVVVVPHPSLAQRAFALRPIADLLGRRTVVPMVTTHDCGPSSGVSSTQPSSRLPAGAMGPSFGEPPPPQARTVGELLDALDEASLEETAYRF